jgi:hypothetical protein
MTKSDVSAADKAMIDKLAAEYADELNNLGVRVSNLEKKSDNVKFTGLMRLDGTKHSDGYKGQDDSVVGTGLLRLDINAAVNDNWAVKARLDGQTSLNSDKGDANGDDKVTLKRIYAEGPLFGADTKVGKFGAFDSDNLTNGGLIIDTDLTGAEFIFGNALKTKVTYGRLDTADIAAIGHSTSAADYAAIQFGYTAGKVALGAGYTYLKDNSDTNVFTTNYGDDKVGIWNVGFDYALSKDFTFGGEYAASDADASKVGRDSDEEKAYSAQLTYKGAKSDVAGSYGLWAAYRSIGELATIAPTYDGAEAGLKGYELGVNYMLDKNIMTKVVYFDGSEITSDNDVKKVFGRLEFAF